MKFILLLFLTVSCATTQRRANPFPSCPGPVIELLDGQEWTDRDSKYLWSEIVEGCKRKYGPRACVTRVVKVREQGYQVLCRR